MKKFRHSVHSEQQVWLRELLIQQRKTLGLSQRALAERLGVIYSLIGKIETGDRRLDMLEFLDYCEVLQLDPKDIIDELKARSENLMDF